MKNNNNLLGKLGSKAKNLWSKLDDPTPPPNTEIAPKQDELEVAASAIKKVLSPLSPVADKAKILWDKLDDPELDELEAAASAVKKVLSPLSPVTNKAKDLWHKLDDPMTFPSPNAANGITTKQDDVEVRIAEGNAVGLKLDDPMPIPAANTTSSVPVQTPTTPPQTGPDTLDTEKQSYISKMHLPYKVEGHPIRYAYVYPFVPVENINVKADILGDSEKIVDVDSDNDRIVLTYNNALLGYIENAEKAVMVSDFKKKGLPCHAILLSNGEEVNLRFYKDKRFENEYREQTVCKLTGCKSESKQETISFMDIGDEVDLEEDYDHDDAVIASYQGDPIGKLPKKTALRFLEEGAYAAFLEKLEQDDEFRDIPHIRIYW